VIGELTAAVHRTLSTVHRSERLAFSMSWLGLSLQLALRTLRDPALAPALVRVGWRFRRRRWLKRPPFLPIPDRNYLRWRMLTAYGDPNAVPSADDVARYAKWAVRE